jgi:hypothetical protein
MKVETFDLLQQRQAEVRDQHYEDSYPSGSDETVLYDPSRKQEPLLGWFLKMGQILRPGAYTVQLPEDAEWYCGMHTSHDAVVELEVDPDKSLAAFVLRNMPYDMGEPVRTRLVISETNEPDVDLLTRHPILTVWAGPAGPFAGESPLLRDVTNPTAWQVIVSEIFEDL